MKRRSAGDWDVIISDYRQSSLSQKEYCQKHNFNYWTFRDQRIKRDSDQITSKKLVKVRTRIPVQSKQDFFEKKISIRFPNGITVELPLISDSSHLFQALKDLR